MARKQVANRFGVSDAWVRVGQRYRDLYDEVPGTRSLTRYIMPIRLILLFELFRDEIVEDVCDMSFSILGSAAHTAAEQSGGPDIIIEQRILMPVFLSDDGQDFEVVSMKGDRLELFDYENWEYHLQDFKVWKVSALRFEKKELEIQLNILGWAWRMRGLKVTRLSGEILLRDWDWKEIYFKRKANYPHPLVSLPVFTWTDETCFQWMKTRILTIRDFEKKFLKKHDQAVLPECTREERWGQEDKWVVCNPNAKRRADGSLAAHRGGLKDTKAEAEAFAKVLREKGKRAEVVERKGEFGLRCMFWCPVRRMCNLHPYKDLDLFEMQQRLQMATERDENIARSETDTDSVNDHAGTAKGAVMPWDHGA